MNNKKKQNWKYREDRPFFWNLAHRFIKEYTNWCEIKDFLRDHKAIIKDFADYCDYFDKRRNYAKSGELKQVYGNDPKDDEIQSSIS